MKKKIAFSTLGCKLNQYESDSLMSDFIKNDYEIVSFNDVADAYVINTCTVTNKSDAKSRNLINRVNRLNPSAFLFVTGCYAETDRSTLENIKGVNYVIGNDSKFDLFNIVNCSLSNEPVKINQIKGNRFLYNPAENTLHTRSYLKIQDGCNELCTYCKIPMARGNAESRAKDDILFTIKNLIQFAYKEIIFTGINIGDYFHNNTNLSSLLKEVLSIEGDFRIHISSIEPEKIKNDFLELFNHPKMCKHIHIPLQSGNDRILKLMGRNYSSDIYRNIIYKIREIDEDINITTDVMVGFPTETDNDFMDTLNLLSELDISYVHTFKYSIRNGTPASTIKDQIPEQIKSDRSIKIRRESDKLNLKYRNKFFNKTTKILTEKEIGEGIYTGYSTNYIKTQFFDPNPSIGKFRQVKINKITPFSTFAEII